jgi:hypothetical protein
MSCHCNDRLDLGAARYLVRGETIHTSVGCFHASLFLGTTGQAFLVESAVAPWRKGVEDANRISQEHAARAERAERERAEPVAAARTAALEEVAQFFDQLAAVVTAGRDQSFVRAARAVRALAKVRGVDLPSPSSTAPAATPGTAKEGRRDA